MAAAFFYCDCRTWGKFACLCTAAAMLSYSHEITSKTITTLYFFLCREGSGESVHFHRLRQSTEKSCADSNSDLCAVYKNSECCGEAVPTTMAHLGNHQCVVSMRQKMHPVRCNKIPQ